MKNTGCEINEIKKKFKKSKNKILPKKIKKKYQTLI